MDVRETEVPATHTLQDRGLQSEVGLMRWKMRAWTWSREDRLGSREVDPGHREVRLVGDCELVNTYMLSCGPASGQAEKQKAFHCS